MAKLTLLLALLLGLVLRVDAQHPRFCALVLYENGGHHLAYSKAARIWLDELALKQHFQVDYIQNTDSISDSYLNKYQLFIQLDYPPYSWNSKAAAAFERYTNKGRGGWLGFHHATLLGEFDGYPIWPWFQQFMGGIRFKNYIATFAKATVRVEQANHPVMKGLPKSFVIGQDEWYTYDKSPRANVQVLANVDEGSYTPSSTIKMGDHPVVWTNPAYKARNIYIFMGHSPNLFYNNAYKKLFSNAIFWAAAQ